MAICIERPDGPLDITGLEATGGQPHYQTTRGSSGRYRTNPPKPPPISRQALTSGLKPTPSGFTMGNFTRTNKMTSEERFAMSQRSASNAVTGPDGPDGNRTRAGRTRSKRGGERNQPNEIHATNMSNNQVALGAGGISTPQRKKLQLLPRSKPVEGGNKVDGGSGDRPGHGGGDGAPPAMSEAEASGKIAEDIEKFFSVRNIDESEDFFTELPSKYHHRLVGKMISKAIESKGAGGELVARAFARAAKKKLCSISAFEEGFLPVAEILDDIAIDAPKAFQIMATMMKGAGLDKDEERRTRIAQKSMDSDKLLGLLA